MYVLIDRGGIFHGAQACLRRVFPLTGVCSQDSQDLAPWVVPPTKAPKPDRVFQWNGVLRRLLAFHSWGGMETTVAYLKRKSNKVLSTKFNAFLFDVSTLKLAQVAVAVSTQSPDNEIALKVLAQDAVWFPTKCKLAEALEVCAIPKKRWKPMPNEVVDGEGAAHDADDIPRGADDDLIGEEDQDDGEDELDSDDATDGCDAPEIGIHPLAPCPEDFLPDEPEGVELAELAWTDGKLNEDWEILQDRQDESALRSRGPAVHHTPWVDKDRFPPGCGVYRSLTFRQWQGRLAGSDTSRGRSWGGATGRSEEEALTCLQDQLWKDFKGVDKSSGAAATASSASSSSSSSTAHPTSTSSACSGSSTKSPSALSHKDALKPSVPGELLESHILLQVPPDGRCLFYSIAACLGPFPHAWRVHERLHGYAPEPEAKAIELSLAKLWAEPWVSALKLNEELEKAEKVESGSHLPDDDDLQKIAKILHISIHVYPGTNLEHFWQPGVPYKAFGPPETTTNKLAQVCFSLAPGGAGVLHGHFDAFIAQNTLEKAPVSNNNLRLTLSMKYVDALEKRAKLRNLEPAG